MQRETIETTYNVPPFEVLERERRKRLLLATSRFLLILFPPIMVPFTALVIAVPAWQTFWVVGETVAILPVTLIMRALVNQGRQGLGSWLILTYMTLMMFGNTILIEGFWPAAAPATATMIIMGGMVLGTTGTYYMTTLVSVLWIIGFWITSTGLIPPIESPSLLQSALLAVITLAAFMFIGFMSQLATKDLRRALDDATYNLVQAMRQLEEANSLKSQFMARTSHELRTPLNSIIGFSDLAVRKVYGPLTDLQDEGLKRVLSNARRLLTLINDILDLSKIEAGEMQLVERDFKLKNLIDTVEATLTPRAKEKNLKLSVLLSPEMPETIVGDEVRMSQIIVNLIDNAIKYTDEGEVEANFDKVSPLQWRIKVRDTGRGIHEKDMTRIFEEFYQGQGDVPGARRDGAGLGLSITNHLVKLMRGKISVESRLGKGSTFEVLLPLKVPQAEAAPAPAEVVRAS